MRGFILNQKSKLRGAAEAGGGGALGAAQFAASCTETFPLLVAELVELTLQINRASPVTACALRAGLGLLRTRAAPLSSLKIHLDGLGQKVHGALPLLHGLLSPPPSANAFATALKQGRFLSAPAALQVARTQSPLVTRGWGFCILGTWLKSDQNSV